MKRTSARCRRSFSRAWFFLCSVVLLIFGFFFLAGASGDRIVYVTNSGQRYHRDACSGLSRSKIAVSLADAVKSGYRACSICKPPDLDTGSGEAGENTAKLYRLNAAGIKTSAAADTGRMLRAEVVDHVDGDTVLVRIPNPPEELGVVETIRLLGVDTPETVHPNQPVQRFGREAADFTKTRLLGQPVYLAFDWDLRDRYGRLLAYIYTEEGRCFNALLIQEGYAYAYLDYPFQLIDEFHSLEQDARKKGAGLWAP